jgi:hypothetical protein
LQRSYEKIGYYWSVRDIYYDSNLEEYTEKIIISF